MTLQIRIAYFSMEIAADADVPSFSGGLGMLAGDIVRSAADLHVPMVAVTLLARKASIRLRLASFSLVRSNARLIAASFFSVPM